MIFENTFINIGSQIDFSIHMSVWNETFEGSEDIELKCKDNDSDVDEERGPIAFDFDRIRTIYKIPVSKIENMKISCIRYADSRALKKCLVHENKSDFS